MFRLFAKKNNKKDAKKVMVKVITMEIQSGLVEETITDKAGLQGLVVNSYDILSVTEL